MKIRVLKNDVDEIIFTYENEEYSMEFNNIKKISKVLLDKIIDEEEFNLDIKAENPDLDLYSSTIERVLNSIKEDSELIELFSEVTVSKEQKDV